MDDKVVGFVGWRGMVGSVLLQRMLEENDFRGLTPRFYSTSRAGAVGPTLYGTTLQVQDAHDLRSLAGSDFIVTCQGSDYTRAIYPVLRAQGWTGYWIDAASALRMADDACIVLDPVNRAQINQAVAGGIRLFVGGNCSITLSLMGLAGLLRAGLIEWLSVMTYQAASGAGAKQAREFIAQSIYLGEHLDKGDLGADTPVLSLMDKVRKVTSSQGLPTAALGAPLVGGLIPWIDSDCGDGDSREEWKGEVETNKILGLPPATIAVNGLCVRVGVLRCHSAAITMKLKRDVSEQEFADLTRSSHAWVTYVPNNKFDSVRHLTPTAVSGSLQIGVGRYKKLRFGTEPIYTVFTVGDQLLWGAAEPLRRMLNILLGRDV